ncbi:hypothetical protein SEA_BIGSWOLE_242 [Mycobacterium phage Bigswole]|uniref:Uncharacterized protein n=1 Tax=Mycobacterium phage Bigswole TaxID=2041521 RepID=A0A2D1G7N3_9CAUD|nr:hypothetical protein KHO58_gp118 [Mycobacterium phage Bigswole]ATN87878.1 hypothetical protein SEA_BIGSWOLE_242 [Mycobacterium phage Bigswole]AVR77706.1 hypothetical protein SEA_INTERFOLIA_238 [Mycobacterium phage InterFolia]QAY09508.1 hypothetical protein SEA_PATTER_239 [Mycobacterium phage Patter]QED11394.1 hypothetical protein SEA_LOLAVINCA_233 [Mycobacterium phage LolaVinca]
MALFRGVCLLTPEQMNMLALGAEPYADDVFAPTLQWELAMAHQVKVVPEWPPMVDLNDGWSVFNMDGRLYAFNEKTVEKTVEESMKRIASESGRLSLLPDEFVTWRHRPFLFGDCGSIGLLQQASSTHRWEGLI